MITPDGTRLISQHRHEMVRHIDDNDFPATLIDVFDTNSHGKIREWFKWCSCGEIGRYGIVPTKYTQLMNMEESNIIDVLKKQTTLPQHIKKVFVDELQYRKKNLT